MGTERGLIEGKHCYDVIHGIGRPWGQCVHVRAIETKSTIVEEMFYPRLNRWLRMSVSPVCKGGQIMGTVHVTTDITERWEGKRVCEEGLALRCGGEDCTCRRLRNGTLLRTRLLCRGGLQQLRPRPPGLPGQCCIYGRHDPPHRPVADSAAH